MKKKLKNNKSINDQTKELKKIKELLDDGLINLEDYNKMKNKILGNDTENN